MTELEQAKMILDALSNAGTVALLMLILWKVWGLLEYLVKSTVEKLDELTASRKTDD